MKQKELALFYAPNIEQDRYLPEEEAKHIFRVLRLSNGDYIKITDGKGHFFLAEITETGKNKAAVSILEKEIIAKNWDSNFIVAIAPTKQFDRMEWMLEKMVEIGIDRVVFLKSERSERKNIKAERLEKIAVSAIKQSLKSYIPKIEVDVDYKTFIKETRSIDANKMIAHCIDEIEKDDIHRIIFNSDKKNSIVLIGPEGDFSEREVNLAIENGYKSISLGKSRLRSETAAIFALSNMHIVNNLK